MKKRRKRRRSKPSPRRTPAPRALSAGENSSEGWDDETPPKMAAQEREWEELPDSDEETKVVLLPVNPCLVHVYWGIAADHRKEVERIFRQPGPSAQPVLRFYEGARANFEATRTPSWFDIGIDLPSRNWYVHLKSPGKAYCVDLGLRTPEGVFHPLARSNMAETPRAGLSDSVAESYLIVKGDDPRAVAVVAPVEPGEVVETPPEPREYVEWPWPEVKGAGLTETANSRPVEARVSTGEVTHKVRSLPGRVGGGEQQGGEEKGQEAKELRIYHTMTPEEIQRRLAELYGPRGSEGSSPGPKTASAGKPQPPGMRRADLAELSEKIFRVGISSGQKSSGVDSQSSADALTDD